MSTLKLTDAAVKRLKAPDPSGKQVIHWDSEHRGFGVLCSGISSSKTWVVQGRFNGKTKRLKVGPTDRYDRDQAWEKARPILNDIEDGIDPKVERKRRASASVTLEQVLEAYVAQPRLSPRTVAAYRDMASKYLNPWLQRPLRSISGDDVEIRFAQIKQDIAKRHAAGKIMGGVNVTGAASANVALQLFGALWNFQLEKDETLGRSPLSRLRKQWHKIHRRKRRLWDQDFPAFYAAVMALPSQLTKDLLRLGLLTGLRENELQGLKWAEIDFRHRMIRLPGARMKSRVPFELPMSSYVHALLVARRAIGVERGGVHVFAGSGKSGHTQSFAWALGQVKEATGLMLSPHDLRRTFLSVATNSGISSVARKQLVGHATDSDTNDGYVSLSVDDLRQASETVCAKIMALCEAEGPLAENVTKLG